MIPSPPQKNPKDVVSFRLDDTERSDLERARGLLARQWNRKVSRGEAIRAAIQCFLVELEKATAENGTLTEASSSQTLPKAPRATRGKSARETESGRAKRERKNRSGAQGRTQSDQ